MCCARECGGLEDSCSEEGTCRNLNKEYKRNNQTTYKTTSAAKSPMDGMVTQPQLFPGSPRCTLCFTLGHQSHSPSVATCKSFSR
uniref:Disintegrin domain-containing protein n=1 Tax=Steinernema glaseri TaxID=37863 RepID=A0A1I8ADT7_9BILA